MDVNGGKSHAMTNRKRFRNPRDPAPSKHTIPAPVQPYNAKLDSKKRIVLRGAKNDYYEVHQKANGSILLTPKVLVDAKVLSKNTLRMIDRSASSLQKGKASPPIDLTEFRSPLSHSSASKTGSATRRKKK